MKDKFTKKSECFRKDLKIRHVMKGNMGSE